MDNIVQMMMGAAGAAGETDPYFNQTTLLLHGDGTNGAQNNTFLDSSSNNFTITRNGNTTQGTFSPFSLPNGEWSNYFDGSGDYLSVADNAAFTLGSGDFTIECWLYSTTSGARQFIAGQADSGGADASTSFAFLRTINNKLEGVIRSSTTGYTVTSSASIPLNAWTHVAFVRDGNTNRLYINGVQDGTLSVTGVTVLDSSNQVSIGRLGEYDGSYYYGYISNFRLVKGTCLYTGGTTFTPPTSPLTAVANTSLLTCQSNRFKDNSTNNFAITPAGNVSVQPFSPFLPSAAYSPSVNGGSGYFGTGNYLTAPDDNFWDLTSSTGSIEMFLYSTAAQTNGNGLVGQNSATGDWGGYVYADGKIAIGIQGSTELATAAGNLVNNTWIHVVFTRDNSTGRTRIFVNGVLKATGTGTYFANSSNPLQIINFNDGTNRSFVGYVADIRFCKGSIPTTYQTASTTIDASIFTPPTAPLTVSSQGATSADTKLLLNFTNAGIFDNTGKNNLETVGNAQIDTTTKKYGTGSMEFDGNGDYLLAPTSSNNLFDFGTGNFTVEMWFYANSLSASDYAALCGCHNSGTSQWAAYVRSNGIFFFGADGTLTGAGTISTGTWHYYAAVRNGNTLTVYLDGVSVDSDDVTGDSYTSSGVGFRVGDDPSGANPAFNGFIDDLRITKGIARYTANFTPPSRAFPDL